jgi:rare lipoprotein A
MQHLGKNLARTSVALSAVAVAALLLAGCGEKKQHARVAPPPDISFPAPAPSPSSSSASRVVIPNNAKSLYTEVGIASWYGPPYNHRKAANGEVFDMNQPSAAHKTLPLNSVVRVTNLANGRSIVLRINDRGPFVGDRILDLSLGAAKEIGLWRMGLAKVKMEVLETPAPIDTGGRWCVQIGAFTDTEEASDLKARLMRKYSTAKVIQFTGPTGEWVRLRPLNDDRKKAFEVANQTHVNEGGVFLVRLD